MDSDAPESLESGPTTPEIDERDAELARLRERVAFYQSFDGLIQENIERSSVLLKEAIDVRETASQQIASVHANVEKLKNVERTRYRGLFSTMLDELTALQGQAERLARRLSDALDEIESDLPTSADLPPIGIAETSRTDTGAGIVTEPDRLRIQAEESLNEPPAVTNNASAPQRPTVVLVHGVPRATLALSLKRYLEGLADIGSVEPREFAEGILRLEISGDRALAFDDLKRWPEGARLEPIHVRHDLLEVKLPN